MSLFAYKALNSSGDVVTGTVESENKDNVVSILTDKQYTLLSLSKKRTAVKLKLSTGQAVPKKALLQFTIHLLALVKAGLPLLECLRLLKGQTSDEKMKDILVDLCTHIEEGESLSQAMQNHPRVFSELYLNSINVGEISGTLFEVLGSLGDYLEKDIKISGNIKKALRYPALVFVALIGAFIVFIAMVIPRFVPIFEKSQEALPLPTQVILGLNTLLTEYWLPVILAVALITVVLYKIVRTPKGKYLLDSLMLKLPLAGSMIKKISIQRFSQTLALLNSNGIPLVHAIETAAKLESNQIVRAEILNMRQNVEEGENIASAMDKTKFFPEVMVHMISVGETAGTLDVMLTNMSNLVSEELDQTIENLTGLIEPIVTVVLAGMVLFLALSIFLPMWNLLNVV